MSSPSGTVWLASVAIVISALALLFTVGSFWWLHARRGQLISFEPHTYAAAITREPGVRIRLPLVLYNEGATPIVVQNLRLSFPGEPNSTELPWITLRHQIKPEKGESYDFRSVFAVGGRTAHQIFPEFGAASLGFTLEAKDYPVLIEAKLGHEKKWRQLLIFTLRAGYLTEPGHYITYENVPDNLPEERLQKAEVALRKLAQELNPKPNDGETS